MPISHRSSQQLQIVLRLIAALALLPLAVLQSTHSAYAKTHAVFLVTKTTDSADGACDADCSLREAVIAANAQAGSSTIRLPNGNYGLFRPVTGSNGAEDGDLNISANVVITPASSVGRPNITVFGFGLLGASWNDRIFRIVSGTVELHSMTIQGGRGSMGGAVSVQTYHPVTLTNVVITGSIAEFWGGGIENYGHVILVNSKIISNSAGTGGGIANLSGTVDLYNSQVISNSATTGGGLDTTNSGVGVAKVQIVNSIIGQNVASANGGGIYSGNADAVDHIQIILQNSQLISNTALKGGAIFGSGQIDSEGTYFIGNTAQQGGAIRTDEGIDVPRINLNQSTFQQNSSTQDGGAIYAYNSAINAKDSTWQENHAGTRGGGMFLIYGQYALTRTLMLTNSSGDDGAGFYSASDGKISDSVFAGNSAQADGGGVNNSGRNMQVARSAFYDNSAQNYGGGLANSNGKVNIVDSSVYHNLGGGLYNTGSSAPTANAQLLITNTVIYSNTSDKRGAGLVNFWYARLNNVTVSDNHSNGSEVEQGGGLYSTNHPSITLVLLNSIVAGNSDGGNTSPDCAGKIVSAGYNLLANDKGCGFVPLGNTDLVGNTGNPIDALLSPYLVVTNTLANQSVTVLPLLEGSPALNAASPNQTPAEDACASTDMRGLTRPQSGRCDIGAFEGALPLASIPTPTPTPSPSQHLVYLPMLSR